MIKKTHRLPLGDKKTSGKKKHTPLFILIVAKPDTTHSRVAIIVSTSVSKKAVTRNRIKRQIAAIMQPVLKSPPHHDYLIITKPGAGNASFQNLKDSLKSALRETASATP